MKRGVDIIVSLGMIVFVLSWLVPIVGLCILIDSRGGVFFLQSRDGLNGKSFYCIKFRTMRPNWAAHLIQAKANDDRITRFGNFLRKSHIDELPQFINILRGEMSLIGPRPHMHRDTAHYGRIIDNYMKRLNVKPGFSGLAQVYDLTGNTSNTQEMAFRVRMDNFYVDHASPALDMYIIGQSLRIAFRKVRSFVSLTAAKYGDANLEADARNARRLRRAA